MMARKLPGVTESDDDLVNDILHGRYFINQEERRQEAWKIFVGMDLDSMLKGLTGLDNLEKFKRTWKSNEQWEEPDTDEHANYVRSMYPALAIYYPIEERSKDVYLKLRGKLQKQVNGKLQEIGIDINKLGWEPEMGDSGDISGKITKHIVGYISGWVSYHRLDDYDVMSVLYR